MKQVLYVEAGNYNITISDESFSKTFEEINSITSGQNRLFVISKKVYTIYKTFFNP